MGILSETQIEDTGISKFTAGNRSHSPVRHGYRVTFNINSQQSKLLRPECEHCPLSLANRDLYPGLIACQPAQQLFISDDPCYKPGDLQELFRVYGMNETACGYYAEDFRNMLQLSAGLLTLEPGASGIKYKDILNTFAAG